MPLTTLPEYAHVFAAVHVAATVFMTGLIWFVQVVHYPLMARVGPDGFVAYEQAHMRLTTWVVAPAMLVELASGAALLMAPPALLAPGVVIAGLAMLALIWVSTATLQVPQHRRLRVAFDARTVARLVATNWVRTALWSGRSMLLLAALTLEMH